MAADLDSSLRIEDFLAQLTRTRSRNEVLTVLHKAGLRLGMSNTVIAEPATGEFSHRGKHLDFWVPHYRQRGHFAHDRVVHRALAGIAPVLWESDAPPPRLDPKEARIFREAHDFGLQGGLCLVSRAPEQTLLFAFFHDLPQPERPRPEQTSMFLTLIAHTHERLRQLDLQPPTALILTERERTCLSLVKDGLTMAVIAERCSISERTVIYHLNNCRSKLKAATLPQAVAKALVGGLIAP